MAICNVCNKSAILPENYGNISLCKICALKIHSSFWKNKVYNSNEEVEAQRTKVISLALSNNFPTTVVSELSKHFENKKIDGLIKKFDGHKGQILTVYEDRCIIDTTHNFDFSEAEKAYIKISTPGKRNSSSFMEMLDDVDGTEFISEIVTDIMVDLIPSKTLKKVTRMTKSAVNNQFSNYEKKVNARKPIYLNILSGEETYKYCDYDIIKYIEPYGDEQYGFIKLQNSRYKDHSENDIVFFFSNDTNSKKTSKYLYEYMKERINLFNIPNTNNSTIISPPSASISYADEILKYKNLLDLGAITLEEYEIKKKQLLEL